MTFCVGRVPYVPTDPLWYIYSALVGQRDTNGGNNMAAPAENMVNAQLEQWINNFDKALGSGDIPAAVALFDDDCYWRDFLTFTWNLDTSEGPDAIRAMLDSTLSGTRPSLSLIHI